MIYSDDINKICAVCVNAVKIAGDDTHMRCSVKHEDTELGGSCKKFKYDILKKPTRRRKLKTNYSPEDFNI